MPVFNGAQFLGRSVASILTQSFPYWEVLAVDDGSTDDSYNLLCHYAATDLRIRPFRLLENRGPSAARNLALQHARGSMITYLDCDDEYYLHYLEWVHRCRHKADVFVFAYDWIDETGLIPGPCEFGTWDPAFVRDWLLMENVACPLGIAHRRDLLEKVGLFDETISILEDWNLWRRFALAGAEFIYLPIKSGLYHIRGDSLSRTERVPEAIKAMERLGSAVRPTGSAPDEPPVQQADELSRPIWVG
jgi:glycosyltransferase involved in cell wall biosynthesis